MQLTFNTTKVAVTYNDDNLKDKIYNLRNFGIRNEEVADIGINNE